MWGNLGVIMAVSFESMDTDTLAIIIVIVLAVVAAAVFFVADLIHKQKGRDSLAKKRIGEIVEQAIPEGERVTAAFADWLTVDNDYKAGRRTTRYWQFAIGFNDNRIYIIPVTIYDNETIKPKECICVERSQLGLVNGKENGKWMELYTKEQKKICTLKVEAYYTKGLGGSQLVDIAQPEAAAEFKKLIRLWLKVVNDTNGVRATGYYNNAQALDLKTQNSDPENKGMAASAQSKRRL